MTVEYVVVESGGQAVVGHIETGKTAGARKRRVKRMPKAIPNDPGETIDVDLGVKQSAPRRKS